MTIESKKRSRLGEGLTVLGLVGLLGAALMVQGCFVDATPSGPPVCYDGAIETSWVLHSGGRVVECASGDEVDLTVSGQPYTFSCFDHGGQTGSLPADYSYDVSLALYDRAGHLLSSTTTMPLYVPCGTLQPTPLVDFAL